MHLYLSAQAPPCIHNPFTFPEEEQLPVVPPQPMASSELVQQARGNRRCG